MTDRWQASLHGAEMVFHQDWERGVCTSWGEGFEVHTTNNMLATQRLLEAVRARQAAVTYGSGTGEPRRFVNASSHSSSSI